MIGVKGKLKGLRIGKISGGGTNRLMKMMIKLLILVVRLRQNLWLVKELKVKVN